MQITKTCMHCKKEFSIPHWRNAAKFCGTECSALSKVAKPQTNCSQCGSIFHAKSSRIKRSTKTLGIFCSHKCVAIAKSKKYLGDKNPNFKGVNIDSDGYRIYVPQASNVISELVGMKLHRAVACEFFGVKKIPKGLHIHHRDCDILNNDPRNLAVLAASNHKWLHQQFGVATLWAIYHGKIDIDEASSWSDDPAKASFLLMQDIVLQSQITKLMGVVDPVKFISEIGVPPRVEFVEVSELSETTRGSRGFGSTGA